MAKKILLVVPFASAFAGPISKALQEMGHTVSLFDYRKGNFTTRFLGTISNHFNIEKTKTLSTFLIQNQLKSLATHWKPDIILIMKGETISPETVYHLRRNATIVNWYPDWMVLWDWVKLHAPAYSYFFTMCQDLAKHVKNINPNTAYIPPAAEPDEKLSRKTKKYPISFVGQYSERREMYLNEIKDLGLHLWGYQGWRTSSLKNLAQAEVSYEQTLEILRQTKITFNILTGSDTFQPKAINNRTFETLGVGTFLLVHRTSLLKYYFTEGQDFATFTTPADLRRKMQYYLKHERERNNIALHGWNTIKQKHLYTHRLQHMLKKLI